MTGSGGEAAHLPWSLSDTWRQDLCLLLYVSLPGMVASGHIAVGGHSTNIVCYMKHLRPRLGKLPMVQEKFIQQEHLHMIMTMLRLKVINLAES